MSASVPRLEQGLCKRLTRNSVEVRIQNVSRLVSVDMTGSVVSVTLMNPLRAVIEKTGIIL